MQDDEWVFNGGGLNGTPYLLQPSSMRLEKKYLYFWQQKNISTAEKRATCTQVFLHLWDISKWIKLTEDAF
jgi:hypothetical protein